MEKEAREKILVVKIGAIGDVVMALPMLKSLRDNHPAAKITWISGRREMSLLQYTGWVDELIAVDETALFNSGWHRRVLTVAAVWRRLLLRSFDLALVGHADPNYKMLLLFCRVKTLRSFARKTKLIFPVPGRHHSDEYLRLANELDGPDMEPGMLPVISPELVPPLAAQVQKDGFKGVVALAPGGAKNSLRDDALRRWPLQRYVQLAKALSDSGYRVVVTGGISDQWVCDAFKGVKVDIMVGETSLLDLVALYRHCDVVVTHDSGPLHLAGLAGVKVLGLFGPTNPVEKIPRSRGAVYLWGGPKLACRPCYDGRNYGNCQVNRCLEQITVAEVSRKVLEMLAVR